MKKKRRIAWMNVGLRSIINVIKATDWSHPALWLLNSEDFKEGAFQETFIKMADILLHKYGSSRSEKLNVLLTHMGEYIIKNRHLLEKAEAKWDKL